MVERLHRQIKTAIKCHETEAWTEVLPVVMMGIRSAVKEDLHATPAKLVYGETMRLPGEFLQETTQPNETSDFLLRLRKTIEDLRPQPIKRHGLPAIFQHKDLTNTTHVFLRHNAPMRALQPTFDGLYEVLNKGEKIFKLRINGRTVHVTIDRLKPAYILADQEPSDNLVRHISQHRILQQTFHLRKTQHGVAECHEKQYVFKSRLQNNEGSDVAVRVTNDTCLRDACNTGSSQQRR
ncbi:uncharacterized protein [Temnothorax longispinosus]|uniref:uncharacterized protein n=1 Tax=Temnothorax longispinosus TaxID=300112 RepID=UPI003A99C348